MYSLLDNKAVVDETPHPAGGTNPSLVPPSHGQPQTLQGGSEFGTHEPAPSQEWQLGSQQLSVEHIPSAEHVPAKQLAVSSHSLSDVHSGVGEGEGDGLGEPDGEGEGEAEGDGLGEPDGDGDGDPEVDPHEGPHAHALAHGSSVPHAHSPGGHDGGGSVKSTPDPFPGSEAEHVSVGFETLLHGEADGDGEEDGEGDGEGKGDGEEDGDPVGQGGHGEAPHVKQPPKPSGPHGHVGEGEAEGEPEGNGEGERKGDGDGNGEMKGEGDKKGDGDGTTTGRIVITAIMGEVV